jgi:putative MATE family efflux protein
MRLSATDRTVLGIAAPAVVELILTSLTALVDTVMVGRLGPWAISAVGLTSQPRFIMLAVFIALNVGSTALVARFKGQNDKANAEIVTMQSIFLTLILAGALTVPGILFARPMVIFMGAGPDTVDAAEGFFRITMTGFVPTALPLAISALLRGVGDTMISMRYNLAANLVNLVFNYLLIYGKFGFPELGVYGSAVATVIGNCAASAMAIYAIAGQRFHRRKNRASDFLELKFTRRACMPNAAMLARIVNIGLPSALEQLALRAGLLIYTITVTGLGTAVFAAHQIVLTILNLSFVNGQAFGIAATTLTGQALGRSDHDAAKTASRSCQHIGCAISTALGILMFVFRKPLMLLFTNDPEIIALGAGIMILTALLQPFQSSFQIYAGALRGAGDALYPALSMIAGILIIRPSLSYGFITIAGWGLFGAWLALTVDQFTRFILIRLRYKSGKWVHKIV